MCTAGLNQQIICKYIVDLIKIPMHLQKIIVTLGDEGRKLNPVQTLSARSLPIYTIYRVLFQDVLVLVNSFIF